jgi:uncharacterized protein (TIGR02594 family)
MQSKNYKHLAKKESLPKILQEMLKNEGIAETQGNENNPVIMGWARTLGSKRLGVLYTSDSNQPWCGLGLAIAVFNAGYEPPPICIRAASWKTWGVKSWQPMLGDVLVFARDGGNHVGLYIAEDATHFHVLGGNQGDMVCVKRIAKSRLMEARRTRWVSGQPESVKRYFVKTSGAVSENEA